MTNKTKIVADYFDFGCILSEILSVNEELREAYEIAFKRLNLSDLDDLLKFERVN